MNYVHIDLIAKELKLASKQVQATAALLEEDATVPFIARYRKEMTGSLDEVVITTIRDRLMQLAELDKRRETILKSITEQGKLTDELKEKIAKLPAWARELIDKLQKEAAPNNAELQRLRHQLSSVKENARKIDDRCSVLANPSSAPSSDTSAASPRRCA